MTDKSLGPAEPGTDQIITTRLLDGLQLARNELIRAARLLENDPDALAHINDAIRVAYSTLLAAGRLP